MDEQNNERVATLQREHDRELLELEGKYLVLSEEHLVLRAEFDVNIERIIKLTKPTFDCFLVYRTETNYGFELKFKKRYGLSEGLSDAVHTVPVLVEGMCSMTAGSVGEVEADNEEEDEDDKDCTKRLLDDKEKYSLLHDLIVYNDGFYEEISNTVECSNKFIIEKYVEQRDELNDKDTQLHKKKKYLKKWINAHSKQRDKLHRKDKRYERVVIELDEFEQMHLRVVFEFRGKVLQDAFRIRKLSKVSEEEKKSANQWKYSCIILFILLCIQSFWYNK
jgi:hypothetical protein